MKYTQQQSPRGRFAFLGLLLGLLGVVVGCGSDADDTASDSDVSERTAAAVTTYSKIVSASYADSLEAAEELDTKVQEFLEEPSQETLEAARDAWRMAREPYLQTEVFRFYDGPIDNPDDGPEGMLNAWPLDEAYIDYVEGDANAGIINDPELEISAESLMALNEQGGEENIATGYHAIEFLLWGQDMSDDGPGDRPFGDYIEGEGSNAERRALYLSTVSSLLVEHLSGLAEAWASGADDNYRASFEQEKPSEALRRILTGMIILSGFETGGERLQAALDSGSQEDEHSCFSDNTHRDMVQDIQGVWNVWHGSYEGLDGSKLSGPAVREVISALDQELLVALDNRIDESLVLANDIMPPFDREIAPDNDEGNARVRALVQSLHAQEDELEDAFLKLGLEVPVAE